MSVIARERSQGTKQFVSGELAVMSLTKGHRLLKANANILVDAKGRDACQVPTYAMALKYQKIDLVLSSQGIFRHD